MNRSTLTLILVAASALATAQRNPTSVRPLGSQSGHDYPMQEYFPYEQSDRVTALSIVECLAPGELGARNFEPESAVDASGVPAPKPRSEVWIERVRVVDSPNLAKGLIVRVVVHERPELAFPMSVGRRYLVLAGMPKHRRLETPNGSDFRSGAAVAPAQKDEIVGLAAFETHASTVDRSPEMADRISNSVVDCLGGVDPANVQRVAKWLKITGYPGGGNYNNLLGRESFALSEKLQSVAENAPAYTRYQIYQTLCTWHVFGSEQGWVDAILDLAKEPSNPFLPGDSSTGGELNFSVRRRISDPSYIAFRLDANRWADAVVEARNDAVRGLLLARFDRTADEAHERKLARALLSSPNSSMVAGAALHFSRSLKRPDLEPEFQDRNGVRMWVNQTTTLTFLRTRYGIQSAKVDKQ